jgi:sugar/nucleoside kinase (ribokinase family)
MSHRFGIIAGGNWIVDKLKVVDTYPAQDALANIVSESVGNGGSPFNVLVDLAELGAPFPLAGVGLIGNDADGKWIAARCRRHGIDAAGLRVRPDAPTSYTDVMTVQATGRRTFFHQRGANALLDAGHFDFEGSQAKIFHLGYLLLLDRLDAPDAEFGTVAGRVLDAATRAGCKTSVDVVSEDGDRFARVILPTLRQVDYCILNEFEAERTIGVTIRREAGIDQSALVTAARGLLDAGVREWVIIHYPEGACALGRDGSLFVQGSVRLPEAKIVGAVGAGDAFAAGMLHGLHEGTGIGTALHHGVCAAASCLEAAGCSDGLRPLEECLQLGRTYGFRA